MKALLGELPIDLYAELPASSAAVERPNVALNERRLGGLAPVASPAGHPRSTCQLRRFAGLVCVVEQR